MPPKRPDFVTTSYIPYGERSACYNNSFHIKPNSRDSCDNFAEFQMVKRRCLSRSIESDSQTTKFRLWKQFL